MKIEQRILNARSKETNINLIAKLGKIQFLRFVYSAKTGEITTSNVGGLFSEAVYRVGLPGALIYVFGISGYVSFMYYLKRKGNYYHGSAALAIALIGLCFFCNYFTLLVVLEMIVYLFLMELVILILDKKKIVIKDWRIKQKCRLIRY